MFSCFVKLNYNQNNVTQQGFPVTFTFITQKHITYNHADP